MIEKMMTEKLLKDLLRKSFKEGTRTGYDIAKESIESLKEKAPDEYKPGLEVAIDFINELIEGQQ